MLVLKVGGNDLDNAEFLRGFASAVAALPQRPVIVHGGGRGTSSLMARLGLEPRFVKGLRVTDEQVLPLAIMGQVGEASVQLVNALVRAGLPALGLCGVDSALVTAERLVLAAGDVGAVGRPVGVEKARLRALLDAGFLPCLAPICRGSGGDILNVNADAVAQAVAAALDAETLVLLTNVPAVRLRGQPVATLSAAQVEAEIAAGEIVGGMIPKVRGALDALAAGVRRVLITDLDGFVAFSRGADAGTLLE